MEALRPILVFTALAGLAYVIFSDKKMMKVDYSDTKKDCADIIVDDLSLADLTVKPMIHSFAIDNSGDFDENGWGNHIPSTNPMFTKMAIGEMNSGKKNIHELFSA